LWQRIRPVKSWRWIFSGICVGVTSGLAGLNPNIVQFWEYQIQTLFFELRGPAAAPADIVILAIDEESLSQGQHYLEQPTEHPELVGISAWPWRRAVYAAVIDRLLAAGAKAVALDIVLSTPSTYGPQDDRSLEQVLRTRGNRVVLAAQYGDIDLRQGDLLQPTLPLPQFQQTPIQVGAINFLIEADGRIHRLSQEFLASLKALETELTGGAALFDDEPILSFAEATLQASQTPYDPLTGDHIFFYGPAQTFTHIPFWYVLDSDPWQSQLQSGAVFKDKIVLVGSTAALHQDFHAAPFSKSFLYPEPIAGVEILANTIATIRGGRALHQWPQSAWLRATLVLMLGLGVSWVIHRSPPQKPLYRLSWAAGSALLWFCISYGAFTGAGVILSTSMPTAGIISLAVVDFAAGIVSERIQKKTLRNTLARYVTSPIVQEIISQQDDLQDLLTIRQSQIVGKILSDRYRIVKILGAGGFGETYLAEDTQRPGSPICVVKQLKIVSDNPGTHRLAQRLFAAEAATLEKLGEHDQIPRLLAYFEANGDFYLVQEMIVGQLLRDTLTQKQHLSQRQTIEFLLDLLPVIQTVHDQGVIHRDIKPSNIIWRERDHRYVLIDFGAVKQISSQLTDTSARITSTVGIGTHGYMPSEQSAGLPNFSSDLYALGITAIEALTGLPPHGLQRSATGEVLWAHQVPNILPALVTVLTRMVRYDFNQRYPSAKAALEALSEIVLDRLPTEAPAQQPVDLGADQPADLAEVEDQPRPDSTQLLPTNWPEVYQASGNHELTEIESEPWDEPDGTQAESSNRQV
jgi:CHASE2 domain-containing sensor protein/serine/threonine protein kinase